MINLLTGDAYLAAIQEQMAKPGKVRVAVAFWGNGADALFGDKETSEIQILCDLSMGSSNAKVIEKLHTRFGDNGIKKVDSFHSKVFIFEDALIIGSANASTSALGAMEAKSPDSILKHIEYGVLLDDPSTTEEAKIWFDDLFSNNGTDITPSDIELLQRRNDLTAKMKSRWLGQSVSDFISKIRTGDIIPLINWSTVDCEIPKENQKERSDVRWDVWRESASWVIPSDYSAIQNQLNDAPLWVVAFYANIRGTKTRSVKGQLAYGEVSCLEMILSEAEVNEDGDEMYTSGSIEQQPIIVDVDSRFWAAFNVTINASEKTRQLIALDSGRSIDEKEINWESKGYFAPQLQNSALLAEFWQQFIREYDNSILT